MTFQPVIPQSGLTGWRFLQRTLVAQQTSFSQGAAEKRATDDYRQRIGSVRTAEALVKDRRLLLVSLTAFGLEGDINNKAFIKKILEDGTLDPDALGNKLADKRYLAFSKAFGFGDFDTPRTVLSTFPEEMIARYKTHAFETAVGEQDDSMRLALNVKSGLSDVIATNKSANARWYAIMGSPPLREVFQTALGFSSGFSQLPLDRQLESFKARSESLLGSSNVADFADPAVQDKLIRTYMVRNEASTSGSLSGSVALALLQAAPNLYRR